MVWPGMNQVVGSRCSASRARMRRVAGMPKSPREMAVGVKVLREIADEVLS